MMRLASTKPPAGILHAKAGGQKYALTTFQPSEEAGSVVQHYWVVQWDMRGLPPYTQSVIAHPNVNLVFEQGVTRIYGVPKSASDRVIEGKGWVVGVKFKPGGFYPYWQSPVSDLSGRSVSFKEVFGIEPDQIEDELFEMDDMQRAVERVEAFITETLPAKDPNVDIVSQLVYRIRDDRSIVSVEDAAGLYGIHVRSLQRLFGKYVGVSPKWVIKRYRLHEAAEWISQGAVTDWSGLSSELDYYDQSHFIRDFKNVVGRTPQSYVREDV